MQISEGSMILRQRKRWGTQGIRILRGEWVRRHVSEKGAS